MRGDGSATALRHKDKVCIWDQGGNEWNSGKWKDSQDEQARMHEKVDKEV